MISDKYFIMMYNQKRTCIMPIVGEDDLPVLFDSKIEAESAAESHVYAQALGYEIHRVDGDCA